MTEPIDLAPIQAREAAATDGPWYADGHEILVGTADDITRHSHWIGETCTTELPDWGNANAEFAAHARQDVPALLAEVTRDRAELARLRAELATRPGCPDPIECDHEAAQGEAEARLAAVLAVCDAAEYQAARTWSPQPVPEWVVAVRAAAQPS